MQALLEHFITQSVMYSLIAVALVAFLESLALVGLILPGTVMMAGLGALSAAVRSISGRHGWPGLSAVCWATGSPSGWAGALRSRCTAGRS